MKTDRTKRASSNIIFGSLQKIYQMIIPFLMRTLMIYFMGVQYLGLNSLYTSILQVLNLAELGIGTAMVYSMYKPIAEEDNITISALLKLYKIYYRVIGCVIAIVGLIAVPLIPHLVTGDIPSELNLQILYLLHLSATVFSYWFFAYKNCLLVAHQRFDVVSKTTMVINTVQYILQIIVLVAVQNYYLFLIIALANQICINVVTYFVASRMYPDIKAVGMIDEGIKKEINGKIKDLFISKIGGTILNSADTIVISAFLGLTFLALYQNYYFLITSVLGLIEIILTSITASIGNSYVIESRTKNYNDMMKFTFLFFWLVGVCTCCFLGLFQPFIKIWVGSELLLPSAVVPCFCAYFLCYSVTRLLNVFKNAAGVWHEDRLRPLVSATVNLGLNLLTVKWLGVYGVILSTVVALGCIELPWLVHNIFSVMYSRELMKEYVKRVVQYSGGIIASCLIVVLSISFVDLGKWASLIVDFAICVIVPNILYMIIYRKHNEYKESIKLADRITRGKLKLIRFIASGE